MTVFEMITELQQLDPSTLVVIETGGRQYSLYPVDGDRIREFRLEDAPDGESYDCVSIQPCDW